MPSLSDIPSFESITETLTEGAKTAATMATFGPILGVIATALSMVNNLQQQLMPNYSFVLFALAALIFCFNYNETSNQQRKLQENTNVQKALLQQIANNAMGKIQIKLEGPLEKKEDYNNKCKL